MELVIIAVAVVLCVAVGICAFYFGINYRKKIAESKLGSAEDEAKKITEDAQREGERLKKEAILQAKDDMLKQKEELENENKSRKKELQEVEYRINQRQDLVDKRAALIEEKENNIIRKSEVVTAREQELTKAEAKQTEELSRISRLSEAEAKQQLMNKLSKEMDVEMSDYIKNTVSKAKFEADKKAKEYIVQAIQRCAADHTSEATVTSVSLPSDDMKGRIIGREGRNIKTIETLTGIDLIIDDTPDVIVLSSFDPIRREVARLAIERLIYDGRIHPAKIEEMIDKAKVEVANTIKEEGERAAYEAGITNLNHDIIELLGKLKYRTSYGQNVLNHSLEVSHVAGLLAVELGLDPVMAKRAGLLHDIGKSVDHEVEGTHVEIGVDILKKYKESPEIINAVEAHHGDVEPQTLIAVLVQAADAISASRPGARRETVETYIKRLEKIEAICNSYEGVEKSYAIQAGREVRIIVKPDVVNDQTMPIVARNIANQIEQDVNYPGQIKVNVIRETRVIELAK
ncbi:MAG: ribonuclease Y [Clostridia bacterium]